jgi:hypothetical protein
MFIYEIVKQQGEVMLSALTLVRVTMTMIMTMTSPLNPS